MAHETEHWRGCLGKTRGGNRVGWALPGGLTVKDTFTRCHLKEPLLYFSASAEVAWPSTSLFILL